MFHKILSVKTMPNYIILVFFENGETKKYDVSLLFNKWESFKTLESVTGLFEQVKVDVGGYGISWNDDIDLSCDELYQNGVLCCTGN